MCFVCISEQTAIISLYNINWPVVITETLCLLRGTDCTLSVTQFTLVLKPVTMPYIPADI